MASGVAVELPAPIPAPSSKVLPLLGHGPAIAHTHHQKTAPTAARRLLQDVFQEQVRRRPHAPAISSWDGYMCYSQLDQASSRLAAQLIGLGVGPETIVPVLSEKSLWTVAAMLAVAKAGAAFLALDVEHPDERLSDIIRDTSATTLLASPSQQSRLHIDTIRSIVVVSEDALARMPATTQHLELPQPPTPDNMLYAIYTSGSTGKPKGVIIEHTAFVTSAFAHGAAQGFSEKSRVLQFASYAFDASVQEIFTTLAFGGCICIPRHEDRYGDLAAFINKTGVNLAVLTPSYAQLLEPSMIPSLQTLVLCGEPVSSQLVHTWRDSVNILIGYGPTESSICCAVASTSESLDTITGLIGQPVGCNCWIVHEDDHHRLVGKGEAGELLIEGPILARGYLNDEQKTSNAFIQSPAWSAAGTRLYKTGDLVRRLNDGNLVFLGRKDSQVKINGMRFELTEIESHLTALLPPTMVSCVEKVELDGKAQLVAFVSRSILSANDATPQYSEDIGTEFISMVSQIRSDLAKIIPTAMVPSRLVPLDFIPLSASGKVDRKSLRNLHIKLPVEQPASTPDPSHSSTLNPTQSLLRDLWAAVLHRDSSTINLDHDFTQLGGDSLTSIKLVGLAREKGLSLTTSMILTNPRLDDLANAVTRTSDDHEEVIAPFTLLNDPAAAQMLRFAGSALCKVDPSSIEDILPASMFQMHMIGTTMAKPQAYVAQHYFRLPLDLDLDRFRNALDVTVSSAELLRTRFIASPDRKLFQAVLKHESIHLPIVDELETYSKQDMTIPMTVGTPLSRYALVKKDGEPPIFVWTIHHAIYDGYSVSLILDAISKAYHGSAPATFTPFNRYLQGSQGQDFVEAEKFWTSHLTGSKWAVFPPTLPDRGTPSRPARLARSVTLQSRQEGVMLTTLIRVAFAMALRPYSDDPEGTLFLEALSGRNSAIPGVDRIAGPTVKTVPTRISLGESSTLTKVQEYLAQRLRHEAFPIARLLPLWPDFALRCLLVIQDSEMFTGRNGIFEEVSTGVSAGAEEGIPVNFVCHMKKEALEIEVGWNEVAVGTDEMERFVSRFEDAFAALSSQEGSAALIL